ncbi:alkaline phosphatase [Litoribacillus peritrichatus]|uniref:Alkaline phosphatase n=1 Tax=Litoribacillus peritrichatus TaxID=718191 RepID=A0ABP7NEZ7_9GAMM
MNFKKTLLAAIMSSTVFMAGCSDSDSSNSNDAPNVDTPAQSAAQGESKNAWFNQGANAVAAAANNAPNIQTAKNVILFVGDGMGVSTTTAARILEGQQRGETGEENNLAWDTFPYVALAKTYNTDQQTPDSAGTMTAMMTGVKSDAGVIGVDEDVERSECNTVAGNELVSAVSLAEIAGKATGVVSTARITHATPAATYAVSPERGWEDDAEIAESNDDGHNTAGCEDIASQLVSYDYGDGIDVILGGGLRHFIPQDDGGRREDGRDLTQLWVDGAAENTTRAFVSDKAGLQGVNLEQTDQLMGLFTSSHMSYEADRDDAEEPSLTEMTEAAIDMLSKDDDGFVLVVESGRIDHGHHAGNAYRALTDAIEFSDAVKAALAKVDLDETLVMVTADHSHVFTIAGYPKRGNPILGKVVGVDDQVAVGADNMPYTTVGYMNGPGASNPANNDARGAGRIDLSEVDTQAEGFYQESLVPRGSETHAGEDVGIYAAGPWAHLAQGTLEQNMIFHIINKATGLVELADAALAD